MSATIDPSRLAVFVEVADAASFSAAAKTLGTTTATVSRDIAKLEAEVGTRLLHRTTRSVALTTAGAALYERTSVHVRALREAARDLPDQQPEPAGVLKLTAPYDLGATVLGSVIARFTQRYPRVHIRADFSSRTVDLGAEGFDVAIRGDAWKRADPSWSVKRLVRRSEFGFYASPACVARKGSPREVGATEQTWLLPTPLKRLLALPRHFEASVEANDFLFLREIARAGAGVAMLPVFIASPLVTSGELVRVLPQTRVVVGGLVLVYPSAKPLSRKIAAFRDFLVQTLAREWVE